VVCCGLPPAPLLPFSPPFYARFILFTACALFTFGRHFLDWPCLTRAFTHYTRRLPVTTPSFTAFTYVVAVTTLLYRLHGWFVYHGSTHSSFTWVYQFCPTLPHVGLFVIPSRSTHYYARFLTCRALAAARVPFAGLLRSSHHHTATGATTSPTLVPPYYTTCTYTAPSLTTTWFTRVLWFVFFVCGLPGFAFSAHMVVASISRRFFIAVRYARLRFGLFPPCGCCALAIFTYTSHLYLVVTPHFGFVALPHPTQLRLYTPHLHTPVGWLACYKKKRKEETWLGWVVLLPVAICAFPQFPGYSVVIAPHLFSWFLPQFYVTFDIYAFSPHQLCCCIYSCLPIYTNTHSTLLVVWVSHFLWFFYLLYSSGSPLHWFSSGHFGLPLTVFVSSVIPPVRLHILVVPHYPTAIPFPVICTRSVIIYQLFQLLSTKIYAFPLHYPCGCFFLRHLHLHLTIVGVLFIVLFVVTFLIVARCALYITLAFYICPDICYPVVGHCRLAWTYVTRPGVAFVVTRQFQLTVLVCADGSPRGFPSWLLLLRLLQFLGFMVYLPWFDVPLLLFQFIHCCWLLFCCLVWFWCPFPYDITLPLYRTRVTKHLWFDSVYPLTIPRFVTTFTLTYVPSLQFAHICTHFKAFPLCIYDFSYVYTVPGSLITRVTYTPLCWLFTLFTIPVYLPRHTAVSLHSANWKSDLTRYHPSPTYYRWLAFYRAAVWLGWLFILPLLFAEKKKKKKKVLLRRSTTLLQRHAWWCLLHGFLTPAWFGSGSCVQEKRFRVHPATVSLRYHTRSLFPFTRGYHFLPPTRSRLPVHKHCRTFAVYAHTCIPRCVRSPVTDWFTRYIPYFTFTSTTRFTLQFGYGFTFIWLLPHLQLFSTLAPQFVLDTVICYDIGCCCVLDILCYTFVIGTLPRFSQLPFGVTRLVPLLVVILLPLFSSPVLGCTFHGLRIYLLLPHAPHTHTYHVVPHTCALLGYGLGWVLVATPLRSVPVYFSWLHAHTILILVHVTVLYHVRLQFYLHLLPVYSRDCQLVYATHVTLYAHCVLRCVAATPHLVCLALRLRRFTAFTSATPTTTYYTFRGFRAHGSLRTALHIFTLHAFTPDLPFVLLRLYLLLPATPFLAVHHLAPRSTLRLRLSFTFAHTFTATHRTRARTTRRRISHCLPRSFSRFVTAVPLRVDVLLFPTTLSFAVCYGYHTLLPFFPGSAVHLLFGYVLPDTVTYLTHLPSGSGCPVQFSSYISSTTTHVAVTFRTGLVVYLPHTVGSTFSWLRLYGSHLLLVYPISVTSLTLRAHCLRYIWTHTRSRLHHTFPHAHTHRSVWFTRTHLTILTVHHGRLHLLPVTTRSRFGCVLVCVGFVHVLLRCSVTSRLHVAHHTTLFPTFGFPILPLPTILVVDIYLRTFLHTHFLRSHYAPPFAPTLCIFTPYVSFTHTTRLPVAPFAV